MIGWDVSTATYEGKSFDTSSEEIYPYGIFIKPDGSKMYITGEEHASVYQYSLDTEWDISTATYDTKTKDVSSE